MTRVAFCPGMLRDQSNGFACAVGPFRIATPQRAKQCSIGVGLAAIRVADAFAGSTIRLQQIAELGSKVSEEA